MLTSVPEMALDMAGSVMDDTLVEMTGGRESTSIVDTAVHEADSPGEILARILLIPDPRTMQELARPRAARD